MVIWGELGDYAQVSTEQKIQGHNALLSILMGFTREFGKTKIIKLKEVYTWQVAVKQMCFDFRG